MTFNKSNGIGNIRQQMFQIMLQNKAKLRDKEEAESIAMLSKVKASGSGVASFNYEELNRLFMEKGVNALLDELKNLRSSGAVESIKVNTDSASGKTTITCEADGIEYTFVGAVGDNLKTEKSEEENTSSNTKTENTTTTTTTGNTTGTSTKTTGSITGNTSGTTDTTQTTGTTGTTQTNGTTGTTQTTGTSGVNKTETDPHYSQGYTLDELNKAFMGIYPYTDYWKEHEELVDEDLRETYEKFKPGTSIWEPGHVACDGSANVILDLAFVEIDGKYYMRSDFSFDGKHYETIEDLKQLYIDYGFWRPAYYTKSNGKYNINVVNPDTMSPIIVTKQDLDNCGYNFLPEEIDAYFEKLSSGKYKMRRYNQIFYNFDDFVSYLKGGHTAVIGNHNMEYHAGITLPPACLNDPDNGLFHEFEMNNILNQAESYFHMNSSYGQDLPKNKLDVMGIEDLTKNLESFFVKTQHGEYVLNQEKIKQFFPDKNIKSWNDLLQALMDLRTEEIPEAEVKALGFTPVKTASEFQKILQSNPNAKIYLMNDIDLSGVNWTPVGTESAPFTGSICGNGHTIKNLTVTSNSYYTGMFGVTDGANIIDLTIENAKVKNTNSDTMRSAQEENATGILVGYAKNSTLRANIKNSSVEGRDSVGGLVGKIDGGTCSGDIGYPTTIKGGYDVGGVAGHVVNAKEVSGRCGALVYGGKFLGGIAGFVERCNNINGKLGLEQGERYIEEEGKKDITQYGRALTCDNEGVYTLKSKQDEYNNNGKDFVLLNPDDKNVAWGCLIGGKSSEVVSHGFEPSADVGAIYDIDPVTGEMTTYSTKKDTTESSSLDERVSRVKIYNYKEHAYDNKYAYKNYDTNIYPRRSEADVDIYNLVGDSNSDNGKFSSGAIYHGQYVVRSCYYGYGYPMNELINNAGGDLVAERLGEDIASLFYEKKESSTLGTSWSPRQDMYAYGHPMWGCMEEYMLDEICKEFAVDLFGKEIVDQCFTKDKDGNYILKPGAKLDGLNIDSLNFLAMYVQIEGIDGAHAGCINNAEYVAKNCGVGDYQTPNPVTMGEQCYMASDDYTSVFMVGMRTDTEQDFLDNVTSEEEIENWYVKEVTIDEYGNNKIIFRKATLEDCHKPGKKFGIFYHIVSCDTAKYEYKNNNIVYIDVKNIPPEISSGDTTINVPIEKRFKAYTDESGSFDSLRSDILELKEQLKEKLSGYISSNEFERVFERMLSYTIEYSSIPLPPNTPEDDKVIWLSQRTLERTVKALIENLKNYKQIENSGYAAPSIENRQQNNNFNISTANMSAEVRTIFEDLMQKMSGAVDWDVSSYLKQFTDDTIKFLIAKYGYTESFAASVTDYIQYFVVENCGNSRDTVSQKYLEFINDTSFVDNCYGISMSSGDQIEYYKRFTDIQYKKGDGVSYIELGKKYNGKSTVPSFADFLTYICEIDKNVGFECTDAQRTIILQKIFEKFSENFANSGETSDRDLKNNIYIGWEEKYYDLNSDGRWIDEFCKVAESVFAEINASGITQSDVNVANKVNLDVMLKNHPNGISAQDLINEEFDFTWSEDSGTRKLMLSLVEQYKTYRLNNTAFSQEAIMTTFIKLINDKLGVPNSEPPVLTRETLEKLNSAGIDSINSLTSEANFDYYYMSAYMPKTSQVQNDLYTGDVYNIDVQKDRIVLVTNTKTGEVYEIDLNKMVENLDGERAKNMAYNVLLSSPAEVLIDMWNEVTFYSHAIAAAGTFNGGTEVHITSIVAGVMTHETGHAMAETGLTKYIYTEEFQNAFNKCLQRLKDAGIRPWDKAQWPEVYFTANTHECFAEIYEMLMLGENSNHGDEYMKTYFQECIELVKKYIKEIRSMDYDTRRK